MIKIYFLVGIYLINLVRINAQDFGPLVKIAWQNSNLLKAKIFHLESALLATKVAKAMYGPEIKFGTQYTLAEGGRNISFPVGDLLNPVYSTLNSVTQTNAFPQISNVNEQFLPNNFYDAKFRITQPIYYPDLAINKKLKMETVQLKDLEIKAFRRQISRDVMIAWFQFDAAKKALSIYLTADTLLTEAMRTTQSLIKNGVALPSALSRIETQISIIDAQQADAIANARNAERYLRFTLGINESDVLPTIINLPTLPQLLSMKDDEREELLQVKQGIKLQGLTIEKEDQFYRPRLAAQLDLGSQDFDFGFEPYALLGINLEVNIYDSKKHKYRKEAAIVDIKASNVQMEHLSDQIELMVRVTKENLDAALIQANTYLTRKNATRKIYSEVMRKYIEGTSGYLELIDAQTQITQIDLQHLIAQNSAWVKWAEHIYATASFPIAD